MWRRRRYLEWLDFAGRTSDRELQGCIMDLHWFLNNGGLGQAFRDIARFLFYGVRVVAAPSIKRQCPASLLIVTDVTGVGGLLTLIPLLEAMPRDVAVCLAVTALVEQNPAFSRAASDRLGIRVINVERTRGKAIFDLPLIRSLLALSRGARRLLPTLPLFILRHHMYSAVARSLVCEGKTRAVVILNERMLPSACFSAIARSRNVPVIAVQHGNFVDNYLPVLAGRYLTWGDFHSVWLRQRTTCDAKAIGAPRMDSVTFVRPALAGLHGAGAARIVFFSQVGAASVAPEMIDAVRREVLSLLTNNTIEVIIKLHPNDSRENWLGVHKSAAHATFLDGDVSLAEAIEKADVVCSFYSTVLVEALLWAIPVVQLNPFPLQVSAFPDSSGITVVPDAGALIDLIAALRQSPAARDRMFAHQRSLSEGYFREPGKACHRFWEALPLKSTLVTSA